MINANNGSAIDLTVELRSGHHYGVFIDDTGSPGLNTPGLSAQRKTWVAVLIPPHQIIEVMDELPNALMFLGELGLDDPEFHFTDIWAGKGEFKRLDLQKRLSIFRFMAETFARYRFRVLVQTLNPDDAFDIHTRPQWPERFGPLRFDDHEDLALIFLLLRVRQFLKSIEESNATACVIVDEGRLTNGKAIILPTLAPTFHAGTVLFASSRLAQPIQLADFAAYVLNRSQLLLVKETLTELDKTFLEIVSPVAECFINIDSLQVQDPSNLESLRHYRK